MFGLGFLGKLGALASSVARAWSPLALWPDGISTPGMWSSPSTLPASFNDYAGTTPVATPGTVADSANPVGLALDIRAGAPDTLGPELVVNGDFSNGATGWTLEAGWSVSGGQATMTNSSSVQVIYQSGLTAGKTYLASVDVVSVSAQGFNFYCGERFASVSLTSPGTYTAILLCGANGVLGVCANDPGTTGTIDNISFKEIPGNHMLQSTSAARPLESARVNLLTYTEDFSYNPVISGLSSITADSVIGPYGDMDGTTLTEDTGIYDHTVRSNTTAAIVAGNVYTRSCFFKKGSTGRNAQFGMTYGGDSFGAVVDLDSGSIVTGVTGVGTVISSSVTTVGGWYFCSVSGTLGPSITACLPYEALSNKSTYEGTVGPPYHGDGTSYIYVFGRDFRAHSDLPVIYQSVPTDGSTYTSTGITPWQLYDGTDDGMATASFAAGTLIDGMDCMIVVRRDAGTVGIAGLSDGPINNAFFGFFHDSNNTDPHFGTCGTPTTWVDGVQLAGGTATTRATLYNALTTGEWHVFELRGLDLSAWTATAFSSFSGANWRLNGARGDIMLFPSPADAADRDNARQYLADKYGVTLP